MDRVDVSSKLAFTGLALMALTATGCNGGKTLYPVRGQVFFEGRPATGALVVLHPVDDTSPAAIRPAGYVDDTGNVKLMSYIAASRAARDGAPAGEYIVTIAWLPADVKEYLSKRPNSELPDKLQGRYSQPHSSTLRATVLPQPTELPRIDLKKDGASLTALRRSISQRRLQSAFLLGLGVGGFSHG
jgi:hypothetical protein